MEDEDLDWEESAQFVGPCDCQHEPDEHGWLGCLVEGCICEGNWEE